jgi:hypothetical protein
MPRTAYIGAGAGFAGDRTDAAGPVVEALSRCNGPRFIMFETLAERTRAPIPGAAITRSSTRSKRCTAPGPREAQACAGTFRRGLSMGFARPQGQRS